MGHINANELKTRGVVAIEQALADKPEAIVSVRGKERFVDYLNYLPSETNLFEPEFN